MSDQGAPGSRGVEPRNRTAVPREQARRGTENDVTTLVRPLALDDSQAALDEYGGEVWYQGAPEETLPEDPTPDDGGNGLATDGDVSSGNA